MSELLIILFIVVVVYGIYWDTKRIKKMVVPPPPKPAPLVEKFKFQEPTEEQLERKRHAIAERYIEAPPNQMTPSEWAQIQEMIALGNLNVADRISAGIGISIIIFGSAAVPGAFWAPLGVGLLFWWLVPRPFTKAYEQARDRALRT